MYVEQVSKQTGTLNIKSQGRVKNEKAITFLKKKGILVLLVDPARSEPPIVVEQSEEDKKSVNSLSTELVEEDSVPTLSFDEEINNAAASYDNAKNAHKKLLDSIAKGLPVKLETTQKISEGFVESLQRNPNALMCMTHMKQKDAYLLEHSLNVGILLASFGRYLGFDNNVINELALAGMLHDIGKVKIPDNILHKPGRLTDEEMTVMQGHVVEGVNAIQNLDGITPIIMKVVSQHHERLDGKGYPTGLDDDTISLHGRLVSIVDAYDAMTADRCYKKGMPATKALKILKQNAETHFDKFLVGQFIKCLGIYPVGTLVRLKSEKLALVMDVNEAKPEQPKVKVFYSLRMNHFTEIKDIDLASNRVNDKIIEAVRAEECPVDYKKFFNECVCV